MICALHSPKDATSALRWLWNADEIRPDTDLYEEEVGRPVLGGLEEPPNNKLPVLADRPDGWEEEERVEAIGGCTSTTPASLASSSSPSMD